jgi:hypothetical protein
LARFLLPYLLYGGNVGFRFGHKTTPMSVAEQQAHRDQKHEDWKSLFRQHNFGFEGGKLGWIDT